MHAGIASPGNERWMKAQEVLAEYAKANGQRAGLSESLAEYLREGKVRARARRIVDRHEGNLSACWSAEVKEMPGKSARQLDPQPVPAAIFQKSKKWKKDVANWRWVNNDFAVTQGRGAQRKFVLIRAVEFCLDDIEDVLNSPASNSPSGKNPEKTKWRHFAWQLALVAFQIGSAEKRLFESQGALRKRMDKVGSDRKIVSFAPDSSTWETEIRLFAAAFPELFVRTVNLEADKEA